MTLGELLRAAMKAVPETGNIHGTCVICGANTDIGLSVKNVVSDNFTGWSRLVSGHCFCPDCAYLFSDSTFRKKSWVASAEDGFRTFKNDEAMSILFDPPKPPFFVYIAKAGQRQSWLACLHRVAGSRDKYFFGHESYDVPVLFERERAEKMRSDALLGLERGITKTELLSGHFRPKTWMSAYESGWSDWLRSVERYHGEILWEVMVDVARAVGRESTH